MGPNRKKHGHPDAWHYACHRTPTLRQRIWEVLSSRAVFLVLGIVAIVMVAIAVGLGVALVR